MAAKNPSATPSPAEHLLDLYRMMARIRAFENAAEETSRGGVAVFGADCFYWELNLKRSAHSILE